MTGARRGSDSQTKMTFGRWRSHGYRRLESRSIRRNTMASIRSYVSGHRLLKPAPASNAPFSGSNWTASFRSWRRNHPSASPQELSICESAPPDVMVSNSIDELEAFLLDAWSSASDANLSSGIAGKEWLEYGRKMAELRRLHELRMAEIAQREATFVRQLLCHDESTPLLSADQLSMTTELNSVITEARRSGKFEKMRLRLKNETAAAVAALKGKHWRRRRNKRSRQWPTRTVVFYNYSSEAEALDDAVNLSGFSLARVEEDYGSLEEIDGRWSSSL